MFTKSKHISKSTNKIDIKANWNVAKILNKSDVEEMKQRLSTIQNGVVERINDRFIQSTNFVCPICGGKLVKRGKSTEGFQRYHCLVCKKNMISNYDTIFYHNKLKLWQMIGILSGMLELKGERKIALSVSTTPLTVHNNKLKLLSVFPKQTDDKLWSAEAIVDEFYFANSKDIEFTNSNIDKRKIKKRGLSKNQICVYSACSSHGNHLKLQFGGFGKPNAQRTAWALDKILDVSKVRTIQSDGESTYSIYSRDKNINCKSEKKNPALRWINSIHARLRNFLSHFWGIKIKNLQLFLNWFCYIFKWTYIGLREKINKITGLFVSKKFRYVKLS